MLDEIHFSGVGTCGLGSQIKVIRVIPIVNTWMELHGLILSFKKRILNIITIRVRDGIFELKPVAKYLSMPIDSTMSFFE